MSEYKTQGSFNVAGGSHSRIIARYITQECLRDYKINVFLPIYGPLDGVDGIPRCPDNLWQYQI